MYQYYELRRTRQYNLLTIPGILAQRSLDREGSGMNRWWHYRMASNISPWIQHEYHPSGREIRTLLILFSVLHHAIKSIHSRRNQIMWFQIFQILPVSPLSSRDKLHDKHITPHPLPSIFSPLQSQPLNFDILHRQYFPSFPSSPQDVNINSFDWSTPIL